MSVKCPAIAAAAAISGLTRWVRPPRPWRPSKLRLLVEAQRSPGLQDIGIHAQAHGAARLAPLEAGVLKDVGPDLPASACALTVCDPGTTMARTLRIHVVPLGNARGGAQIFDARIRARADKHAIDRDLFNRRAGLETHVLERALGGTCARLSLLRV